MIQFRHPLGHAVIVGVFRLKRKFEKSSSGRSRKAVRISHDAAITSQLAQNWIAITNQSQAYVTVFSSQSWRSKGGAHERIVEIGRSYSQLTSLKHKNSTVVPRELSENGKGSWVLT